MGNKQAAKSPPYNVLNADDDLRANHQTRDHFLNLSELHQRLAPYYSHMGHPLIDPALIIQMAAVGYSS